MSHDSQAPICKHEVFDIIMHTIYEGGYSSTLKKLRGNRSSKLPLILLAAAVLGIIAVSVLLSSDLGGTPTSQVVETSHLITPLDYQLDFGESTAHLLIDVRTPEEFDSGHIQDAINISVETLPDRLTEVPGDLPIVVYCRSGNRSATAARILVSAGYQPVYDLGGIQTWIAEGYPVEY
jgi:rhodanese-related sulfurtransferase